MTESNRQQRNAQLHRTGTGSVPVLFSLRNVQPNIVGGIANSTKNPETTSNGPTEKSSPKVEATPITAPTMPVAQPASKPAATKSNRSFNVAVGLLVIALCLLVIRNTQSSKNGANATIASNSATSQTGLKTEANSPALPAPFAKTAFSNPPNASTKMDPFSSLPIPTLPALSAIPVAEQKKPEDKPLELGSFGTPTFAPSTNSAASLDLNAPSPSNEPSKDPISLSGPMTNAGADSGGSFERNFVQGKPSLLPPNTKPETTPTANPTLSFPDTRIAMNPAAGNANPSAAPSFNSPERPSSSTYATGTGEVSPAIMETGTSGYTTRQLIDMRSRGTTPTNSFNGQAYPRPTSEPSVHASPISSLTNVTTSSNGNTIPNGSTPYQSVPRAAPSAYQPLPSGSTMLSGQAYPLLPQENPPLKIPPYEQGISSVSQPLQTIRQPAATSSNRYPTTLAPQIPYTPVAPTQSGNSFGYPPGK